MSDPSPADSPALALPRALLRAEARRSVTAAGRRRLLPARCRVGRPGGQAVELPAEADASDAGLLADLVERALDGLDHLAPPPDATGLPVIAWVVRSGELRAGDTDLAWVRAAHSGFARHGLVLPCFLVIGRHGWVDLLHEAGHEWSRVRSSRSGGGAGRT
ncbi:hypothetical protein ASG49_15690 [Marmoricola sp. Leaf446]|uniref:hypothetical protein n=1 Tax=Marmoricola sp. Leaf446 TaxID=1736379 RepID=UPI00070158D6|nr:hypothetical protein [Marmoricola sp. Leaf446]KQT89234.1 hypothetical protein ASG49_15690 [Marmoricola sp. Leaf446]